MWIPISHPIGTKVNANGYINIKTQEGWKREHRIIIEKKLGRKLKENEVVHHRNGIKDDNRLKNLFLTTKNIHSYLHRKKHLPTEDISYKKEVQCLTCKNIFRADRKNRFYCSLGCYHKSKIKRVKCLKCSRLFRTKSHTYQKFCSRKCYFAKRFCRKYKKSSF